MSANATAIEPEPPRMQEEPRRSLVELARNYGVVIATIALAVGLTIASPVFLSSGNLANLLDQWAPAAIMAAGMTLVLIAGGFDLSAGSTFALSGIVAAKIAVDGSLVLGLLAGVGAGVVVGAVNALLVTAGRINAFVATLSTGFIIGGICLAITDGLLITPTDPDFGTLGQGQFLGLTYGVFVMAAVLAVAGFLLHRTILGRRVYAVGGNAEAALLSGIRVQRVKAMTYVVMGGLAGVAGVIQASRVGTGDAAAGGLNLLFNVFAIVIVGGTSLAGGEGAMWRTVIGVAVLAMIGNAFVLLNLSGVYQQVFFGVVILIAVAVDAWGRVRGPAT